MQKKTSPRLALTALAALSLCGAAHAQGGPWYLSPSIGVMDPDSDWAPDKTGPALGLKVGRVLAPHWDLQLGVSTARAKENNQSYRQTLLGADLQYLFGSPGPGFRPLVSLGLGASRDAASGTTSVSKTSPFASLGLGARYQFNDKFALQAEWKRVHSALKGSSRTAFGFDSTNNTRNNYLGLALNYTFGAAPAAAVPIAAMAAPEPKPMAAPPAPPPPEPKPMAAPPPPPPPAPPPAPRMERITLQGTELFALNKADLRPPQPKLDELATMLVDNPSITRVVVSGHTDRLGTDKLNNALSQRRADAVKRYLVGKGVAASRIDAVGKGSKQPVKTCTDKNKAKLVQCLEPNRRVEVEPVTFERQVK